MNKRDLDLINKQWVICYKTQPNQTKSNQTKRTTDFKLNS